MFPPLDGPVHDYMHSSPSCFASFGTILAAEYSSAALRPTHRLSVDTWAVQHAGSVSDRRAVQSVGLHLARLYLQLSAPRSPTETNAVMLDFSRHKRTLEPLEAPQWFSVTAAEVAPFAGTNKHQEKVRAWALATWEDWHTHHDYIRSWLREHGTLQG